jgi:hypothetical protein
MKGFPKKPSQLNAGRSCTVIPAYTIKMLRIEEM